MEFFESELRKLFENGAPILDARFVGRACIARLGETTIVKLEFARLECSNYEALKATVMNRGEGAIDTHVFRFADILGKKPRRDLSGSVMPHIWEKINGETGWYSYIPCAADYRAIAAAVNSYLEVFREPTLMAREAVKPEAGQKSVIEAIRADREKPRRPRVKSEKPKSLSDNEL